MCVEVLLHFSLEPDAILMSYKDCHHKSASSTIYFNLSVLNNVPLVCDQNNCSYLESQHPIADLSAAQISYSSLCL